MSKKIILFLSYAIFLVSYNFAYAGVIINEIMYDLDGADDGREWIEVYNNSDSSIDLSSFKFFENNTNHKLMLIQGDVNIGAQSYAVIVSDPAKFKIDWPNFSGTIFDSSFSLNNSGEVLAIKNGDLIVDQYAYKSNTGSAGDGKSLQKINGVWTSALPTPGKENKIIFAPSPPQKISIAPTPIPVPTKTATSIETSMETPVIDSTQSGSTTGSPENKSQPYFFIIILVLFLGLSAGSVYFIRKKGVIPNIGDDFEIFEE